MSQWQVEQHAYTDEVWINRMFHCWFNVGYAVGDVPGLPRSGEVQPDGGVGLHAQYNRCFISRHLEAY